MKIRNGYRSFTEERSSSGGLVKHGIRTDVSGGNYQYNVQKSRNHR